MHALHTEPLGNLDQLDTREVELLLCRCSLDGPSEVCLAHELGHYFLQTADEDLADTFAAQFLAPAPLIRTRGYRTSDEVREAFRISTTAANRALFVGKKWTGYRLPKTAPEWLLIDWFDGIKTAPVIEYPIEEFGLLEAAMESWRLGGV